MPQPSHDHAFDLDHTPGSTVTQDPTPTGTRRALRAKRRRTRRIRVLSITGIAVTAAVAGTGFAVQAAQGSTAFGLPTGTPSAAANATVTPQAGGRVSVHTDSAVSRADANSEAQMVIATGHLVAQNAQGKVNASELTSSIASLADYRHLSPDTVLTRVATTQAAAETIGAATTEADARAAAAQARAQRIAAIRAQAAADAARQAAANTPDAAKATAKALMASQYGWGDDQYSCLVSLWSKESGWNYRAYNASGATGIPQALPGSKMASVAADWSTNATTQIIWGLGYISGSYGTPCAAWAHSEANNWY